MKKDKREKNIVCFGDESLGCGCGSSWVDVLAELLGGEYNVVCDGVSGRLIATDDPFEKSGNGYNYLVPMLASRSDLDLIVFMLGVADAKNYLNRSPDDMIEDMEKLISAVRELASDTEMVIVSPLLTDEERCSEEYLGSRKKLESFRVMLGDLADRYEIPFIDANDYGDVGSDGIAMLVGVESFASKLKDVIISVLND